MVTSKQCFDKWGDPLTTHDEGKYMVMWDVPANLEIGVIPKRIYCNRAMIQPLTQAFTNLIQRGFVNELKTWDGCFNVRIKRGFERKYASLIKAGKIEEAVKYISLHAWGIAIDVNAFENGLNVTPKLSAGFVKCFTDVGFDWGGACTRKDGMHFQLSKI
jgi:hypothetical protein